MKKARITAGVLFSILLVVLACTPTLVSTPTPSVPAATPAPVSAAPGPAVSSEKAWEKEWESLVAAARKEGNVVILAAGFGPDVRGAIFPAFTKKYGIRAEIVIGPSGVITERIVSERRAKLYFQDVLIGGGTPVVTTLKPAGALDPLEPALILPEVKNPEAWWQGKFPWVDRDRTAAAGLAYPSHSIVINTDLVKPEEIKSYRDLLNPKWKGKIVFDDPTVVGSGLKIFSVVGGEIMGLDFMRELARQEPVITRDWRLMGEWVAHGKYPIAIGVASTVMADLKRAGAPVRAIKFAEGSYVSSGASCISLVNQAPHPNAAKVFINFYLSKEGLTALSRSALQQTTRVDVLTDFLSETREPGVKYIQGDAEELLLKQPERAKLAAEIFGRFIIK